MVSNLGFTPQVRNNVTFGSKKEEPKKDVITEAYNITNDVPKEEKFFSPGGDLAFPAIFGLGYAYKRSDFYLNSLNNKLNNARVAGNADKVKEFTNKIAETTKNIGNGKVNIKAVTNPKGAFKEYWGKFTLGMNAVMEGFEVYNTAQKLGKEAAIKQGFRGAANAIGSTFGWVAGSAIGHKVAGKIGGAIGSLIGGPAGRFVGNLVGNVVGFLGGILGERAMRKAGEKIYGKSELAKAQEAQAANDLKNIDLNDKQTLTQQIVKNQVWLMQYADQTGNIGLTGKKKVDEKIQTVSKATEELYSKFKAAGGTDEELAAALENPEEVVAQQTPANNANVYASGAFNSATVKGDPRFNGYTQKVFA